jgi:hypothetical protein
MQGSQSDAVIRFNDFAFEMKKQLEEGASIHWKGVGTIRKNETGTFQLDADPHILQQPVAARKLIREKASHTVRVGEDERTSEEMMEMLAAPGKKRSYWWVWVIAIMVAALVFIVWHFSMHGINSTAFANIKKLLPAEAGSAYNTLP